MEAARTAIAPKPPSLDALLALARADMAAVDALIRRHMDSPVPVIPALADHLIAGSAKRLRPLLTVAAARLVGGRDDGCLKLAAAVEFIHTATLLHTLDPACGRGLAGRSAPRCPDQDLASRRGGEAGRGRCRTEARRSQPAQHRSCADLHGLSGGHCTVRLPHTGSSVERANRRRLSASDRRL